MNNITRFIILFLTFCVQGQIFAQPLTKKYILSFHHCGIPVCGGPQNHTVFLAESDDAENWSLVPNFPAYQGSVPDVITRGNKLYIFSPGKVKRYDHTSNVWDTNPVTVSITDSAGNTVQFVDPSAYVDDNGMICLFFLNSTGLTGDPAQCISPPCTAYFDSAIEVAGSDGTQFVKQSGNRIAYITNTNFKPTDPDVFKKGNTYYQYISYGTGTMVYSSNSLHGNYTPVATLPNAYLTNNNAGVPCGFFNPANNLFYSYGHRNTANGTEISWAKHADYLTPPTYNSLFTGSSIGLGNVQVASPGICINGFLTTDLPETETVNHIRIFPNPNHGHFNIRSETGIAKLFILDLTGHIIRSYLNIQAGEERSVQNLQQGLYMLQCYDLDNRVSYSKIIIQ